MSNSTTVRGSPSSSIEPLADLDVSDRPGSAEARGRATEWLVPTIRLVGVLAIGLLVLFPLLGLFAVFNFAGARFGWIPTATTFGALWFAIGWVAVAPTWHGARRKIAGSLGALAALVGILVASLAAPTHGRIRHEIEKIEQPGWELEAESVVGNAGCLDSCTEVTRTYRVAAGIDEVRAALSGVIADRGCVAPFPEMFPDSLTCDQNRRTDIEMRVEFSPLADGDTAVEINGRAG